MKVKKVLSFLMAVALLVSCAAMASAEVVEIKNEAELIAFGERVNKGETTLDAKLTADITLTGPWTPIGWGAAGGEIVIEAMSALDAPVDTLYEGTFDGDGHTVSGLTLTAAKAVDVTLDGWSVKALGFFGVVGETGVVKNVRLSAPSVDVTDDADDDWYFAGGVAGILFGRIEDCSVTGGTVIGSEAGGIAASVILGASVSGCSVSNTVVTAEEDSGGIVGECGGAVSNCTISGALTEIGGNNVGGIVGNLWHSGASVTNCTVNGIGGIEGYYAGGVVGDSEGTVANCMASGIGSIGSIEGGYAGGVAGESSGTVANCTASGIGSIEGYTAGGVVGENYGTVANCTASGIDSIKCDYTAGGVAGYNSYVIQNCSASNIVLSSDRRAGGIAGYNDYYGGTIIENCVAVDVAVKADNSGSTSARAGGIAGWSDSPIINCAVVNSSAGSVQAASDGETAYAGGVLGYYATGAPISNCVYPVGVVDTTGIYSAPEEWPIGNISQDEMGDYNLTALASYDATAAKDTLQAIVAILEQGVAVEIEKGKTYTLDVTTLPGTLGFENLTFDWDTDDVSGDVIAIESANGAIVTLKGVELGTANVFCTVSNGIDAELTCAVTVVAAKSGPDSSGGGGSSNCSTFGFGFAAMAFVPFLYRRKR